MSKYLLKSKTESGYIMNEVYDNEIMQTAHIIDGKESYTKEEHAKVMLDYFNSTLRPYESLREVVSTSTNIVLPDELYIKNDLIKSPNKIGKAKLNGYLNPNGYYHKEIGFMQHSSWAVRYCEKHNIDPYTEENIYGLEEDYLQQRGWIKFSITSFGEYVFTQSKVTKDAIKWFKEHINEINENQVSQFENLIENRGIYK